ncbi:MAG: YraN family protein [Clostridia bacterium]|nr:YraN family protein [Clostridia bacterium]
MDRKAFTGTIGEVYAARYLRQNGFDLMSANFKGRLGEIDIVGYRDNCICFVEVKTRSGNMLASPAEFVDERKQKKIAAAASKYMQSEPDCVARFDVIEIFLDEDGELLDINHIRNAFDLT